MTDSSEKCILMLTILLINVAEYSALVHRNKSLDVSLVHKTVWFTHL